jgi:rubrerythrin
MDSQIDKRIEQLKQGITRHQSELHQLKTELYKLVPPPTKFARVYTCPQCGKIGPLEIFKAWREKDRKEHVGEL